MMARELVVPWSRARIYGMHSPGIVRQTITMVFVPHGGRGTQNCGRRELDTEGTEDTEVFGVRRLRWRVENAVASLI
jgi:hypothetical protein